MGEGSNNYFDFLALLKMEELDIRRVVRNNLTIKVSEYFTLVVKFTKYAPLAIDSLVRIFSGRAIGSEEYRNLETIKKLLEDIGCSKYTAPIDGISGACKMGHSDFAAGSAKETLAGLNKFLAAILKAKDPEDTEAVNNRLSQYVPVENFESQSLKQVLGQIDQEEGTRKMRVLAVDDALVILKLITSALEKDYKVYGISDPTLLENFLNQVTPELFILDYNMPKRTGFELVPIIRSFKEHSTTPIIFLTSLGTHESVSAAFALGACDYIVKPLHDEILREKVAKHIVKKKPF
jgi:CheY-like chemotaxis protein